MEIFLTVAFLTICKTVQVNKVTVHINKVSEQVKKKVPVNVHVNEVTALVNKVTVQVNNVLYYLIDT